MGGGAWPFLVGGVTCPNGGRLLRGTTGSEAITVCDGSGPHARYTDEASEPLLRRNLSYAERIL